MKKLKAAFLGAGFMAKTHAQNLRPRQDVEIVAVCDQNLQAAKDLVEEMKLERCQANSDFQEMLSKTSPDLLYVCIPPFAHQGQVVAAAEQGTHLFLEKPLALSLDQARKIAAAVDKSRVTTQMGYQMRFLKSTRKLKTLIDSGEAGRPLQFQGRYWTNMDGKPWWRDISKSGGQIFEQLVHLYNLSSALLGEPRSVIGVVDNLTRQGRGDYSIEDVSLGVLRHGDGAISSISGSNCAVPGRFFPDFRVVCENVTVELRSTGQFWVEPDQVLFYYRDGKVETFLEDDEPYRLESEDFIAAAREGRTAACPVAEGLRDVKLLKALLKSSKKGSIPVTL